MELYNVYDVFTPSTPAVLTFVERDSINSKLVDSIRTPGKQIIVYGHSGSGKTTLLQNKLHQLYENHIKTSCTVGINFDSLMLNAFDQLDKFFIAEHSYTNMTSLLGTVGVDYHSIKSSIELNRSRSESQKDERVLPIQLTPQRLAQFIGEARCCWVIEDFHKVHPSEKVKLSQTMKVFMDMACDYPSTKIIAIGAVGTKCLTGFQKFMFHLWIILKFKKYYRKEKNV